MYSSPEAERRRYWAERRKRDNAAMAYLEEKMRWTSTMYLTYGFILGCVFSLCVAYWIS